MSTVIELKDIVKRYQMGDSVVYALDHVNVKIEYGEFTSIMGPSGSGKSTYAKHYKMNHTDENVFIVSSDEIRLELTGKYDNLEHEEEVWKIYYERINKFRDENENAQENQAQRLSEEDFCIFLIK